MAASIGFEDAEFALSTTSAIGLALTGLLIWIGSFADGWYLAWLVYFLGLAWDIGTFYACMDEEIDGEKSRIGRSMREGAQEHDAFAPSFWMAVVRLIWLHFEYGNGSSILDCPGTLAGAFALANVVNILLINILEGFRMGQNGFLSYQRAILYTHSRKRFMAHTLFAIALNVIRGAIYTTWMWHAGYRRGLLAFIGIRLAQIVLLWIHFCGLVLGPSTVAGKAVRADEVTDDCPVCRERPERVGYTKLDCGHTLCDPCLEQVVLRSLRSEWDRTVERLPAKCFQCRADFKYHNHKAREYRHYKLFLPI